MRTSLRRRLLVALLAAGAAALAAAPKAVESDVSSPEKRRETLAVARRLEAPAPIEALAASVPLPFSPPAFDQTDAEERAAALAAAARNTQSTRVVTEREALESVCARLTPSGTIFSGDEPRLLFGAQTLKTGAHFIVKANGQDYDLELVSIDRTTFTVRHNGEEVTRPIKPSVPGKSK